MHPGHDDPRLAFLAPGLRPRGRRGAAAPANAAAAPPPQTQTTTPTEAVPPEKRGWTLYAVGAGGRQARLLDPLAEARLPGLSRTRSTPCVDWPTTTDQWCWFCCHPFEGRPLPLPVRYDDRRDVFHVAGTFCSFACMKAYNRDDRGRMLPRTDAIGLFERRVRGTWTRASGAAPPRAALRVFGGYLSIEEFRRRGGEVPRAEKQPASKTCETMLPPLVPHQLVVWEHEASAERQTRVHAQQRAATRKSRAASMATLETSPVDFKDTQARNETLRLKRPRAAAGGSGAGAKSSALARVVGLS